MKYIIQVDNRGLPIDTETFNAMKLTESTIYNCELLNIDELYIGNKDDVPIGNINFIRKWLSLHSFNSDMTPIEVPTTLRKEKYLGRGYSIVDFNDVPKTGRYFIKNASILKDFSYTGDISRIQELLKPDNKYVISSEINIISEYRVFVSNYEIQAIQYYDGDVTIFPDIKALREMVGIYYLEKDRPYSYTMDIAVIQTRAEELRTVIIEVHPVVSVGTYGYNCDVLLHMYRQGIEWYKQRR